MRRPVTLLTCLFAALTVTPLRAQTCGAQPGYAAGYAPPVATTYAAGPTYTAGYAPTASTYVDPASVAPLTNNGSFQAQRPAYFDNPSVYTGLPNMGTTAVVAAPVTSYYPGTAYMSTPYQSLRSPLTDSLRGNAAAPVVTSVPTTYTASYDGSIPGQPLPVPVPSGAPATALPTTTTVTPIYTTPAPQEPKGCCLSRFCRSLFGTNYTTSYYRAPVTYYRPATTCDPATGAPVVVQRPCTSYVQQVQRIPSTSLQLNHSPAPAQSPSCPSNCQTPCSGSSCGPTTYGAPTVSPTIGGTSYGTVGQVGAMGPTGSVTNIPTTDPISPATIQPGLPAAPGTSTPNTAPLTGAPTLAPPTGTDSAPVGQPRLEPGSIPALPNNTSAPTQTVAPPPTLSPAQSVSPPTSTTPPQWQLQNPADSTALIRPRADAPSNQSQQQNSAPPQQSVFDNDNFTRAEPIEAPADYVAPYGRQTFFSPRTTPVTKSAPNASPVPPRYDHSDLTTVSMRAPAAAQQPTAIDQTPQRRAFISQPTPRTRDTTWRPAPNQTR